MAIDNQDPNDPGNGMKRLRYPPQDPSIRARLPKSVNSANNAYSGFPPSEPPLDPPMATTYAPQPVGNGQVRWNSNSTTTFWTIASILSIGLNVFLCLIVAGLLTMSGRIQNIITGQSSSVLGGLYDNFVMMDRATIRATIPVETDIPLSIMVPVQTSTSIVLQDPYLYSPNVHIQTGGLNLNAPATIKLPDKLNVGLNFMLPVDTKVHVSLPVSVNIPLNQTELHQPFVGLQEVVRPWYCLFLPKSQSKFLQTCLGAPPASSIIGTTTP